MSKCILGVSAGFHDAAVAVVESGVITFAGHSERYSHKMNDAELNVALLTDALGGRDPDVIAFYENPYKKWLRMLYAGQRPKFYGARQVKQHFFPSSTKDIKTVNYSHHLSHAAAGFQTSTFTESIVLVVDAIGEWDTASIWLARYDSQGCARYKKLWCLSYPHSIGLMYSAMTKLVGLKPNEDEYILMGMAAYGQSQRKKVKPWFDGLRSRHNYHIGVPESLANELSALNSFDLAATAQEMVKSKLEKILSIAETYAESHRIHNLVYMGGVALNCVANAALFKNSIWDAVWIMPNPGDAGSALGAAALAYKHQLEWSGPYLGQAIGKAADPAAVVQELLSVGIAGVAAGRAEFGPRALGNRSLLADPRGPAIKDRVNEIKQRQKFRPFAPVILEEYASEYFDLQGIPGELSPHMQYAVKCKFPEQFPAIVHHDGTSRVQTVSPGSDSGIRAILEEWFAKTGCPMLLNTSLNIKGQPIVNDAADARNFEEQYNVKVFLGR